MQKIDVNNMEQITTIEIPITEGDNYISFPASSADNFGTILTSSIMKDKITKFIKYNPILLEIPITDSDHIEEGVGYYLYSTIPGNIIYNSTGNYLITFDNFKSKILKGWNLLATGNNTLTLPSWCQVLDASTSMPVIILEPKKAYWVNFTDCIKPTFDINSALTIIGAVGTILFTIYLLKEFKIIK